MKYFKHLQGVRNRYRLIKSILIMKLILIFLAIFNLQALANVYSQQKVSINLKSADFKKIITAIQKQTNYHFVFSERKIPAKNVSINVQNENVTDVLDQLLANTDFTYTQLANNLIVITGKNEVIANKVVTGKVVDEKGLPLPGVSIKVKGSGTGTVSDINGGFSINVADDAVLVVSFIGYETQEISVAGKSSINITMQASSKNLNEVVVSALGIKKEERKLGYSVTTVGGDDFNKVKETNVAASLEGRVSGLQISGTNGGPGSSVRVQLRGVTSQSSGSSSPLFVINGVPMDNTQRGASGEWGGADYGDGIANINPDDIESMTVLKGQSASALYGSRAANGVILITTKGGKKNTNFGVEYSTNYQMDKVRNDLDYQNLYGQGVNGQKPTDAASAMNDGSLAWGPRLDGSQVIQFDGKMYPYSAVPNNILSFYNTGHTFTNTVAFTGGGENGAFRFSASDLNNVGVVPNSGLDRKTFNLNTTQSVTKKLDVTLIANYIVDNEKNRTSLSDGPGNPNNVLFLAPNEDQKILAPGYGANGLETQFTNDNYVTNPYFAAYKFSSTTSRNRLITSAAAKYNFTTWAYGQVRIGYDIINDKRVDITPTGTGYNAAGNMNQSNGKITEQNTDILFGAKHDLIKNWLNLDLSVGGNIRKAGDEGTNVSGVNNFIIPYFYSLSNFSNRTGSVYFHSRQTNSAYYTADFAIKDYLVLSTTGRYDTYSTLPDNNRGIFSPSVSGSFIFSDLYHINGLDFGKLRLSYAQTSGEPAATYSDAIYYSLANSINGVPAASFNSTLPNLFLKPYTLTEIEVGTEMKWWGGRFGFDVAYFARKTKNEITQATLDPSTGYSSYYVATGSTQNRGIEVEIHGTPVKTSDFSWTPAFNFTYVKNKILKTDVNNSNISLGTDRPLNGANLAWVVGLPGPQIMASDYLRNASGQIIYDASGLPQKGPQQPMGSTVPKIYGGFNNDFSFKGFNLSFLIDYRYGNKILSATQYYTIYRGLNQLTLPGRETGVVGVGVNPSGGANTVNVPAQTYYQALAKNVSGLDVLDGSFIKLRQVSFGYTIPRTLLSATPFSSINVSLIGRNLWTIMKRSENIDPESGFSPNVGYAGIEGTSIPAVRTYGFSVNFKFKN